MLNYVFDDIRIQYEIHVSTFEFSIKYHKTDYLGFFLKIGTYVSIFDESDELKDNCAYLIQYYTSQNIILLLWYCMDKIFEHYVGRRLNEYNYLTTRKMFLG